MILPIIGAFIGARFMGFFGALIGFFGTIYIRRKIRQGAFNPELKRRRETTFVQTVFTLMGALAKSDGRVSEEEIAHAEKVIARMGLTDARRQEAIDYFRQGTQPDFDLDSQLAQFNAVCGQAFNLRNVLISHLVSSAIADGKIDEAEIALLKRIGAGLGLNMAMLDALFNQARGGFGFGGAGGYQNGQGYQGQSGAGYGRPNSANALNDAYSVLGVAPTDSDAQIKRKYRKLMSEHHPDKLTGQGMPEDMIEMATERAQSIQIAYDLIKKSRGIK